MTRSQEPPARHPPGRWPDRTLEKRSCIVSKKPPPRPAVAVIAGSNMGSAGALQGVALPAVPIVSQVEVEHLYARCMIQRSIGCRMGLQAARRVVTESRTMQSDGTNLNGHVGGRQPAAAGGRSKLYLTGHGRGRQPMRGLTAMLCAVLVLSSVTAEARLPLLSRRGWGYACIASSAWFLTASWRAYDRSQGLSRLIDGGGTDAQLEDWTTRRRRQDRRTQAMLGLTAGVVGTGVYLLRTPEPEELPEPQLGAVLADHGGLRLSVAGDAATGTVGVRLSRRF